MGKWQRRSHTLFDLAEIENGHAHRFRDTFAVELLLKGTPMENVSVLLSHRSVRMTERYYAPWVRARQEQLEEELARTWEQDPVLLKTGYTTGTRKIRASQLIYFHRVGMVGAVGIESINVLEIKEFCGAPWPSKVLEGKGGDSYCPLIAPKKAPRNSDEGPGLCVGASGGLRTH